MEYRYQHNGVEYTISLDPSPDGYIARIGDRKHTVQIERSEGGALTLLIDGRRVSAITASREQDRFVALLGSAVRQFELTRIQSGGRQRRGAAAGSGDLAAQMPGVVREVFVGEGDTVSEGQPLLLLEAMKMEIRVTAPTAGTVTRLRVSAGDTVERGQVLAEVTEIPPG